MISRACGNPEVKPVDFMKLLAGRKTGRLFSHVEAHMEAKFGFN